MVGPMQDSSFFVGRIIETNISLHQVLSCRQGMFLHQDASLIRMCQLLRCSTVYGSYQGIYNIIIISQCQYGTIEKTVCHLINNKYHRSGTCHGFYHRPGYPSHPAENGTGIFSCRCRPACRFLLHMGAAYESDDKGPGIQDRGQRCY